jgi:hypothetical protein
MHESLCETQLKQKALGVAHVVECSQVQDPELNLLLPPKQKQPTDKTMPVEGSVEQAVVEFILKNRDW